MKEYDLGEIVLLLFPFADAMSAKRRPAMVLLDTGDEDILVARVTSQIAQTAFDIDIKDWMQAGLQLPSVVRVDKVATLEKRLVVKRLGVLTSNDYTQILERIKYLCDLVTGS